MTGVQTCALPISPACIELKAGINHKIASIDDAVWFCVHATDETDAEKVDEVLIAKD